MLSERIDQWEKEKIQQGAHEVRLSTSLKLLEHKFPMAPASFRVKIENMPCESLKRLYDKILFAQALEELMEIVNALPTATNF